MPKKLGKLHSIVQENQQIFLRLGIAILAIQTDERLQQLHFTQDTISLDLMDGPTITVPLVSYPRSLNATPAQRQKLQVCGGGEGIH
ncbi:DUF2442 domain-containing protein [Microcoleus vaginatus]|uniref:DUF2442 domain-containing protein n=1 Tax=Microcoleus vaginatus TaxID=119532 RepID=UPI00404093F9